MERGGWWSYIRYDEEQDKPAINRALLRACRRLRAAVSGPHRDHAGDDPGHHGAVAGAAAADPRSDRPRAAAAATASG